MCHNLVQNDCPIVWGGGGGGISCPGVKKVLMLYPEKNIIHCGVLQQTISISACLVDDKLLSKPNGSCQKLSEWCTDRLYTKVRLQFIFPAARNLIGPELIILDSHQRCEEY